MRGSAAAGVDACMHTAQHASRLCAQGQGEESRSQPHTEEGGVVTREGK